MTAPLQEVNGYFDRCGPSYFTGIIGFIIEISVDFLCHSLHRKLRSSLLSTVPVMHTIQWRIGPNMKKSLLIPSLLLIPSALRPLITPADLIAKFSAVLILSHLILSHLLTGNCEDVGPTQ